MSSKPGPARHAGGRPRTVRAPDLRAEVMSMRRREVSIGAGAPVGMGATRQTQDYLDSLWYYLDARQRFFLWNRAECGSDGEACQQSGVGAEEVTGWLQQSPAFRDAYAVLLVSPVVFAQSKLRSLAPKVVRVIDRGLDSEDEKVQLKAAELGLRANGMIQQTVNLTERKMTYEEKLIRMQLEQGIEVPEPILRQLEEE